MNTELPGALLASQELEAGGGGRGFAFGEDPAVMIPSVIPPGNGMCMNVAASIALVPDHLTTGDRVKHPICLTRLQTTAKTG